MLHTYQGVKSIKTMKNILEMISNLKLNPAQKETFINVIKSLNESFGNIGEIVILDKGMTNRSFKFRCGDSWYFLRMPGEGTNKLISRKHEYDVYQVIKDLNISEEVYYINPDNGYKVTAYIENVRVCDAYNLQDVMQCMGRLRNFHNNKLQVKHYFDLFENLEYYQKLRGNIPSIYKDYEDTKLKIYELKSYIDNQKREYTLTHIDAVSDNFLILENGDVKLIDWEYAGMQDPHVDLAMFAIYALYDRHQIDMLIDIYFDGKCLNSIRLKIYCYIAVAGLLWSNWCEYKKTYNLDFGRYALMQYKYAKDFYDIFKKESEVLI